MLQISNDEPEFDSGDESDSESLTAVADRVHTINNVEDLCTTYRCTKSENNAQCTGLILTVQMLAPEAISTPVVGAGDNKRPL